jgi:CubicO group peptidase (beta-lactamase class C family)
MKKLRHLFPMVGLILFNSSLSGQMEYPGERGKQTETIEREIPALMKQYSIPGLSLAIIRNGQIDYAKGFGVRNINTQEPVINSTIFAAASLTKPVFSYLVLKLHDEGKIDIDTPLYKYIPVRYLEKYFIGGSLTEAGFDFEEFKKITGRLVLCHSTGLPVYEASRPLKFDFPPGAQFQYSPFSFRLLELALYCIQGSDEKHFFKTDLNDWVKKYVFDPLGMTRSSMIWRKEFNKTTVAGHDLFNSTSGEFVKNRYAGSQASLYTTAEDYARFIIAVMKGEGLKEKTAAEMLRSQVNMKEENNFWGLGVGLEKATKGLYFWQWGDYGLHKSFMIGSSELQNGLVYFTNSYYGLCPSDDIIKLILGDEHPVFLNSIMVSYTDAIKKWIHLFCIEGVDKGVTAYNKEKLDNKNPVSELLLFAIGDEFLKKNRFNDAASVFTLAAYDYPTSYKAFYKLGASYMYAGKKELAIENYEKSLQINPQYKNAEEKLSNLKGEK